jgi:hypothetical protein
MDGQTGLGLPTNKLAKFIYTLCMIIIFSFLSPGLQGAREPIGDLEVTLKGSSIFINITPQSAIEVAQKVTWNDETKTYSVEMDNGIFSYYGVLDKDLVLQNSIIRNKEGKLIKTLGHDKRVTKLDPEKQRIEIAYYRGDKLKETKEITYAPGLLDSDILFLYLQQKLLMGIRNFQGSVLQKARGIRVNAGFKLYQVNDFEELAPEYDFPAVFKDRTKYDQDVYVYVMQLTGILKVFYPHKYYYAYENTYPYNLLAYWGGEPGMAEFHFFNIDESPDQT